MFWRLMKTLAFTVLVPGTVALCIPHWLMERPPFDLRWEAVPGIVLFVFGAVLYLWCAWDFASKGLGTPAPIDAPRVLVVKGIYRFTRNPMYVGVAAMIFGQATIYKSARVASYGCLVVLGFHLFVLLYEEPTLKRLFGTPYQEYCARVPRWIVRIR